MPLQLPNIPYPNLQFPTQPTGGQGIAAGLAGGLEKGMDAYKAMQLYQQQLEKNKQDQQLKDIQLKYAEPLAKAQLKLQQQKADSPLGGINLSGPAKDAASIYQLEQQLGSNHPTVILAKRSLESQIGGREALMDMRKNPQRYASPQEKKLQDFERQLQIDNPNISPEQISKVASAYINRETELDGMPLPQLSGVANNLRNNVWNGISTVALRNQAAALSGTVNTLKSIDIEPIKTFTGLKGTVEFNKMKVGAIPRSKDWYAYDAFRNGGAIKIMDDLRNALKTSIVPGYVYETLGKLSNPNDPIWGDPKQVQTRWNNTIEMLERQSRNVNRQVERGATAELDNEKIQKVGEAVRNSERINVRRKSDGKKGSVLAKDYDASLYEKL